MVTIEKDLYFNVKYRIRQSFPIIHKKMIEKRWIKKGTFDKKILPYLKFYTAMDGKSPAMCIVWRYKQGHDSKIIEVLMAEERVGFENKGYFWKILSEIKKESPRLAIKIGGLQ